MTYEEIFNASKNTLMNADVSNIPGHLAVEVNIKGDAAGTFYVELKDGQLFVEPYEYHDRDCRFIVSAKDFLKLAQGSLDPVFAFTIGKLKVEGNLEKALEFKKIIDTIK